MHIPSSKYLLLEYCDIPFIPFRAFIWWYTTGVLNTCKLASYSLHVVEDWFSMREMFWAILTLKTYRQDKGSASFIDKIIVRAIAVVIRSAALLAGIVTMIIVAIVMLLLLVSWILFPIICVFEIVINFGILMGFKNLIDANKQLIAWVEAVLIF